MSRREHRDRVRLVDALHVGHHTCIECRLVWVQFHRAERLEQVAAVHLTRCTVQQHHMSPIGIWLGKLLLGEVTGAVLLEPVPIRHTLDVHKHTGLVLYCSQKVDLGNSGEQIAAIAEAVLQRMLYSCVAESCAISCGEELAA